VGLGVGEHPLATLEGVRLDELRPEPRRARHDASVSQLWYNSRWDDEDLSSLKQLNGKDFEFVETGPVTPQ
jgi:hypothetical protein